MNRITLTVLLLTVLVLVGCTLSFTNVDTHGSATDLLDEEQDASPTVSPVFTWPKGSV